MPIVDDSATRVPPSFAYSFGIQGWQDGLAKLKRELERLNQRSCSESDLSDHSINFAITAWHLTDWIWPALAGKHSLLLQFAKDVECPPQDFDILQFKRLCILTCPPLELCQLVTNASKHAIQSPSADRRKASKTPAAPTEYVRVARRTVRHLGIGFGGGRFKVTRAEIVRGARSDPAALLFQQVLDFWSSFAERHLGMAQTG
jgi:hypothetical protein